MLFNRTHLLAAAGLCAASFGTMSLAAPITATSLNLDAGPITSMVEEGSYEDPFSWTWFSFTGNAGDEVTITVRRLTGELDPIFGLWAGALNDTDELIPDFFEGEAPFYDISESDANVDDVLVENITSDYIAGDNDDQLDPLLKGPFEDPQAAYVLPETGTYYIAVSDFDSFSEDIEEVLLEELLIEEIPGSERISEDAFLFEVLDESFFMPITVPMSEFSIEVQNGNTVVPVPAAGFASATLIGGLLLRRRR